MMNFTTLNAFLAQAAPAAQPAPAPQADLMRMLATFAIFGVIFYFVLIRPQQKRAKQQAEMLKSVRAGDKILTSGGVLASVVTVKDKSLTIRSADSKMEITKSALAEIVERSGDSSDS